MTGPEVETRVASISFRQLKLFEAVGRLNSVRRGSEECNLSQPAVTQALAKLEQQIGDVLLERRASGSYLTTGGHIFHRRVTRMFHQIEQALLDLGVPGGCDGARSIANRLSRSQARSLIAIIESGSFAQAADTLQVTKASLQRAARDLESNLRKPIYYRTAAGIVVTRDGTEFGRKLKLALQEIEWGLQELGAARNAGERRITIGALPFGGSVLLASVLDTFVNAHPSAEVNIINEGASVMMRRLRAGDVDFVIGLVQEFTAEDLSHEVFAGTPYEVVARRGHKLTRQGKVTLEELLDQEWVVAAPGASRRSCFESIFAGGRRPKAAIATSSLPIIRRLLNRSDRVTLMTTYELMHEDDTLARVPYGPIEPVPGIGITTRADWLPTQLHLDFIELVRRHMAQGAVLPMLRKAS